jgi:hypothetical protein
MSNFNKYIDIDSSYRDRLQYEVGDFVLEMNNTTNAGSDALTAVNPVSLSFPYDTGLVVNSSLQTITSGSLTINYWQIQLGAGARNTVNFYSGNYIWFPYWAGSSDFYLIVGYDNTTQICSVVGWNLVTPVPLVPPGAGEAYLIFQQLPYNFASPAGVFWDTLQASPSTSQIHLGPLASNKDDAYKGMYLFIPPYGVGATTIFPYLYQNPLFAYQWSAISSYNGTTKIATLRKPVITIPPVGTRYLLTWFSYDSFRSLNYVGTEVFNQPRCANISLISLQVPAFVPLTNSGGGYISDYPYVWVEIYAERGITYSQPIVSASPYSKNALFKCSLIGTQPTKYLQLSSTIGSQTVAFRPNDSLRFRILLPNGEPIKFSPQLLVFFRGNFTYFPGLNFPCAVDQQVQTQACINVSFSS